MFALSHEVEGKIHLNHFYLEKEKERETWLSCWGGGAGVESSVASTTSWALTWWVVKVLDFFCRKRAEEEKEEEEGFGLRERDDEEGRKGLSVRYFWEGNEDLEKVVALLEAGIRVTIDTVVVVITSPPICLLLSSSLLPLYVILLYTPFLPFASDKEEKESTMLHTLFFNLFNFDLDSGGGSAFKVQTQLVSSPVIKIKWIRGNLPYDGEIFIFHISLNSF